MEVNGDNYFEWFKIIRDICLKKILHKYIRIWVDPNDVQLFLQKKREFLIFADFPTGS